MTSRWIDGQNSSYRNWYDQNSENNLDHCTVIQSEDGMRKIKG